MVGAFLNGVILCKCRGRVSTRLPLDEICQFLRRRQVQIVIADDLCQPGVIETLIQENGLRPWVVGACSRLEHKLRLGEEGRSLANETYHLVDLLRELEMPGTAAEVAGRVKLLLWAQVRRRSAFKTARRDKMKLSLVPPQGKISRRQLLHLVLPHYEVVPFVDQSRCQEYQKCRLCVDACPLKAIRVDERKVAIDQEACNGCGACISVCPRRAMDYPTFSLDELDREMEGLLVSEGTLLEPRIIALICQDCLPDESAERPAYPINVLPLRLPCLAMASPWLILRAFDRGAQGLALISRRGRCRAGFDSKKWQESVRFVQELLGFWGIEPERVRVFEVTDDFRHAHQELGKFAGRIAELAPTPLGSTESASVPGDGLLLPALIKGLNNRLGSPQGAVAAAGVPFGWLELDRSKCSGCGLCALECPTEALTASANEEANAYQLLFRHGSCVACGKCVEVCPERCIGLAHTLEPGRMDCSLPLFENRIARCRDCGSIIGPQAMIDRLTVKLLASGESAVSQLGLCPLCKIKAQFTPGKETFEPAIRLD